MSAPLRVGYIGTGFIADAQLKQLARRDDVVVSAFADVDRAAMEKLAARYGVEALYDDYRQMLKSETLDAVCVCTPNRLHAEHSVAALRAGAHVLCEKPMAGSVAEARRMVAAAASAERRLVMGFQYRFDPRTTFLRQARDEGQLGRVLYGRVRALRRRGIPNWGVFGSKALQGGGPLIDIGVHVLEMAHYTMGAPAPVSASADLFTYIGDQPSQGTVCEWPGWDWQTYDVEDLAVGRIRFEDGAVLHIEASFAAHIPGEDWNFELMGDKGGCTWATPTVYTDELGHMVDKTPAWLPDKSGWQDHIDAKMDHFVDHLLYERPNIAPAEDGLAVQQMLNALYASAERQGKEIRIR